MHRVSRYLSIRCFVSFFLGVFLGFVSSTYFLELTKDFANSWQELLGLFSTIFLGSLAIFGEQIRSIIFRPHLKPGDAPIRTDQRTPYKGTDGLLYYVNYSFHRIAIKNIGSISAKEVRTLLTYDQSVKNFIPVPLNWTHWNKSTRDISKGEQAYLDIISKREGEDKYRFCWSSEAGMPVEPILTDYNPKLGNLRLEFFGHDRKVGDVFLRYLDNQDIFEVSHSD